MKPTAYYIPHPTEHIELNQRALVFKVSSHHNPFLEGHEVFTSKVIRMNAGGEFETLNTIYRPDRRIKAQ